MKFENVFVPYRSYWSTPFCRWQGSLAGEHPLKLTAVCAAKSLAKSGCAAARLQGIHFGMTVPQAQSFYGAPWLAALIGADHITGPTISQACATSARVLASAAEAVVHAGLHRRRGGVVDLSTISGNGFGYRLGEIERELPEAACEFGG